ncbi:MAG: FKBP-type peptidyl-prolyl cis-trans isomerase [Oceanospirillaceae bacterium]
MYLKSFKQQVVSITISGKNFSKVFLLAMFLTGCGDNAEEAAFRASLVDKALNDDNSKLGERFLQENRLKENVVQTKSGLQYVVLSSGSGAQPKIQDKVEVHYEGRLVNGDVFDSSYKRAKTSVFPIRGVIAGWRQVLLQMKAGDHWQVFIPAKLAYGATSPSLGIAANSTLIFDIKLIAVIGEKSE